MNEASTGVLHPTPPNSILPARRVSWGAIWAGMFVTVIMEVMFIFLGVACGIATLNPFSNPPSAPAGFSVGAMIWLMVSWLIAVWVGARVAGWMSGGPRRADGTVHGVVVWSFSAAVILLLLTGAIGTALGSSGKGLTFSPNYTAAFGAAGQQSQVVPAPTGRAGNELSLAPNQNTGATENGGSGAGGGHNAWGEALWGFIALILGLAVGAWGGATGVASSDRSLSVNSI